MPITGTWILLLPKILTVRSNVKESRIPFFLNLGTPAVLLKHRFQASRKAINACCGVDLLHL